MQENDYPFGTLEKLRRIENWSKATGHQLKLYFDPSKYGDVGTWFGYFDCMDNSFSKVTFKEIVESLFSYMMENKNV